MLSQPKMDLALVVDCDQSMSPYLNALKERLADTLKLNRKQTRVALIRVRGKELDVDPVFADNVDEILAKIPTYSNSKYDPKEGQPANFLKGMNAAAKLRWNKNAQRVLLVIGKNRQHGSEARNFGDFVFETCSLLNKIEVDVFVIDIERGLKKLFGQLQVVLATQDSSSKFNGECKHVDVAKDTELMGKIKECVCAKQDTTVPTFDDTEDRKNDEPEKPPIKKDMVIRRQYLVLSEPDKSGGVRVFDGSKVSTMYETVLREWNKIVDSKTKDDKLRDALKKGHGLFEQVAHLTKDTKEKITKMENDLRQELQELFKFGGEIKWYQSPRSMRYIPVKLLQQDPCIVVGTEGNLIEIPPSAIHKLRDEPECQNSQDIRSYVREVKMLIAAKCQWPGIKLFDGAQVDMGQTKCTWKTAGLIYGSKDHEGTIYAIEQLFDNNCYLRVKDCSNGKWVELNSRGDKNTSNLKILDARGSGLQSKISTLAQQLKDESVRVKHLESQISTLQRDAKTMKQTKWQLESKISTLQSNIQTEKMKLNQKLSAAEATNKQQKQQYDQLVCDKRDAERAFEKKLQRKQMDVKEKDCQIGDLRDSCSNATSIRDETVQKYERMLDDYRTLKELSETYEEEKKKNQVEGSSLLDVSRGFPAVQDIIKDFETLRSQSYQQAAKQMRKVLKSENKDESNLSRSKRVAELLFELLIKAYERAQAFEQHKVEEIANVHGLDEKDNGHAQTTIQKMMRETFAPIINKVKAAASIEICQDLKGFPSTVLENIHRFAEECFCVCWTIVLSRDPGLTIKPFHFEPDADTAIVFNEQHNIEGFGSNEGERLNFVIWPAIFREDTSSPISKMAAVFVNEIPKWKKKKLKQMENQRKEQEKAEMTGDVETCDIQVDTNNNDADAAKNMG